jgi:hypothetical protein
MVRVAGNVDARLLPHYLGDYEFFYRIKQSGFRLGVCFDARVSAHLAETGIVADASSSGFATVVRELFARRSKSNVIDHWRFVGRHAPYRLRGPIRRMLLRMIVQKFAFRTGLRRLLPVVRWVKRIAARACSAMARRASKGRAQ